MKIPRHCSLARAALVLATLSGSFSAQAQSVDCPWEEIDSARASLSKVWINDGPSIKVKGHESREAFTADLHSCGLHESATHFQTWRTSLIVTNGVAIGSAPVFLVNPVAGGLVFGSAGVSALAGTSAKSMFVESLRGQAHLRPPQPTQLALPPLAIAPHPVDEADRMARAQREERRIAEQQVRLRKIGNGMIIAGSGVLVTSAIVGVYGHEAARPDFRQCADTGYSCSPNNLNYAPAIALGVLGIATTGAGLGLHINAAKTKDYMTVTVSRRF